MKTLTQLIRRNSKLFFKDKGVFFTSIITPVILLVLYATFLANVFKSSFQADGVGEFLSEKMINGLVGGQLLSSLLAVSCITVAFCSNMIMVQDKASGARRDMLISPVKKSTLALSYYISTSLSTLIVCYVAYAIGLIYIACTGWYYTFGDVLLIFLDVFILVMFGTVLSSIINFFLSTQGQISAVGSIVSAGYGFICGAYMPMSSFSAGLRNVLAFSPGTYGTALFRNHALGGVMREMSAQGIPEQAVNGLKDAVDCNIYFFDAKVSIWVMYLIMCGTVAVLLTVYILLNKFLKKKEK